MGNVDEHGMEHLGTITRAGHTITDAVRLPCGCLMGEEGRTFIMEPCRLGCEYYRYAMFERERLGMPLEVEDYRRRN